MNEINKKNTVLFVDDEPRITSALRAIFRKEYTVLIANSGADALSVLSEKKVDVIVSDQRMPEMLGNELLATVSSLYPQTMRILLTGFMDKKAIVDSINEGEVYRFINKPWNNEQMRDVIAEAALASKIPHIEYQTDESPTAPQDSDETDTAYAPLLPEGDRAMLMIEKQKDIRHQIRRFCSQQEIMIYGTQNVEQAIAAATTRQTIGVAIVELSENNEESIQTINLLKQARPELITIALTDEYDAHTAVDLINQGQVFKYLAKPLDIRGFEKTIHNAFLRHNFLKDNTGATQRFKVEKSKSILSSFQNLFKRFANG